MLYDEKRFFCVLPIIFVCAMQMRGREFEKQIQFSGIEMCVYEQFLRKKIILKHCDA